MDEGTQISQTYNEDFRGFLIFILFIVACGLTALMVGVLVAGYKMILKHENRIADRETTMQNEIKKAQDVLNKITCTNAELVTSNKKLVRTNADLVKANQGLVNDVTKELQNKFTSIDEIKQSVDTIKTDVAILKAKQD